MRGGVQFSRQRQAEARARRGGWFSLRCVLLVFALVTTLFWLFVLNRWYAKRYADYIREDYYDPKTSGASDDRGKLVDLVQPVVAPPGSARIVFYATPNCSGRPLQTITNAEEGVCSDDKYKGIRKAGVRVEADDSLVVNVYGSCSSGGTAHYQFSIYPLDGCVQVFNYPKLRFLKFGPSNLGTPQISSEELDIQRREQASYGGGAGLKGSARSSKPAKARIVFSCESSEYFGYQVWANYYGFLTSGQADATWTRLLTAGVRDDLPAVVPGLATFQSKRHLYSRRYSPLNKPDSLTKWFASADKPKEEVIVVIDPDNWLLKDVSPWVDRVRKGFALGEAAYYHGSRTAQKMWRELCLKNCDVDIDTVGVPYVVHRDDLAVIAPLWRMYTLLIKSKLEGHSEEAKIFSAKYKRLDVNWATEMYAYNFASTHAGVKHEVIRRMQVRDVDSERRKSALKDVAMIHVGRAWFPPSYQPAAKWAHTEGKAFRRYGTQVWCKCNYTASAIMPWPVPEDADFQSTKTLELLHYSMEKFGPIPHNPTFRVGPGKQNYGHSVD